MKLILIIPLLVVSACTRYVTPEEKKLIDRCQREAPPWLTASCADNTDPSVRHYRNNT